MINSEYLLFVDEIELLEEEEYQQLTFFFFGVLISKELIEELETDIKKLLNSLGKIKYHAKSYISKKRIII